ncbi:ABC transporter ATP-binding protein/permease [Siculibacillus lacustris]|nr:ABC transporter ATP-binding protein/permease [Siculibacillus lacustris]
MRGSPERRRLFWLVLGLMTVIVSFIGGQIWLNEWQGAFYDALEKRDRPAFVAQAFEFLKIAGTLLTLVVAQTWFTEMIKIRLRAWVTEDLLDDWLEEKRAYLLTFAGEAGANPDQRIHEDSRHLAELTADLGASLFSASLMLFSFVGVLWVLSEQVRFSIGGHLVSIPGYMVWCAVGFALTGSALTWRVGRPMIDDNAARYAREAELRFALVRIGESAEGITLYGGEADERRSVAGLFDAVLVAMRVLAEDLARLTWVTSGYGWLALVVPVLVASPGYFSGAMSLGGLMMVVNAFNQVQSSLRWFVDNFPRIADWRATLRRVEGLHDVLTALDHGEGGIGPHIDCREDADDGFRFEGFELAMPDGRARFATDAVAIVPGERVRIVGEAAVGKTLLFHALAGLWTRGRGIVHRPPPERVMFLPERPYFPLGSLAEAIAYPDQAERFEASAIRAALDSVGLGKLGDDIALVDRWDRRLSLDEQQCLAFGRAVLHRRPWVVMDGATSALDATQHRRMLEALGSLAGVSVISLTREDDGDPWFTRVIGLNRVSDSAVTGTG